MDKVLIGLLGLAFAFGVAILMAWPVEILWNGCLVDAVSWAKPITFWQALGLNILASIMVKSTCSSSDD